MICDEAPGGAFGAIKKRRVLGVSTPAHPMILASALERGGSEEEYYTEGMPLVGEPSVITRITRLCCIRSQSFASLSSPCLSCDRHRLKQERIHLL